MQINKVKYYIKNQISWIYMIINQTIIKNNSNNKFNKYKVINLIIIIIMNKKINNI